MISKKLGGSLLVEILSSESEEDDELQRAITFSLESSAEPKQQRNSDFSSPQPSYYLNFLKGYSAEANKKTVSITDLITDEAKSAILTTYKIDLVWLLEKCPVLQNINVMVIHSDKQVECGKLGPKLHVRQPPLPIPYGCCHGKIMLIKYESFLRVVVSTANLLAIDYDQKTQGLWVQDFPKKVVQPKENEKEAKSVKHNRENNNNLAKDFEETLKDYLQRLGANAEFVSEYSYSDVKIVLITSVPGYHRGSDIPKYGHMKVRKFLADLPLSSKFKNSPILAQFSSIGSLSTDWIHEIYASFTKNSAYINDDNNGTKEKVKVFSKEVLTSTKSVASEIQLVWPTVNFVKHSVNGYSAGGSLCFPNTNYKPFTKELFYEYKPTAGRQIIPPHIKTYTRACSIEIEDNEPSKKKLKLDEKGTAEKKKTFKTDLAWVILSSANLSKAAWGELQKTSSQMLIRHYEAGVLFLPDTNISKSPSFEEDTKENISFPLPYQIPLTDKNTSPWIWDLTYIEKDILGESWIPGEG
jgi:tyrosyl-DNA phosphodiesterase-1